MLDLTKTYRTRDGSQTGICLCRTEYGWGDHYFKIAGKLYGPQWSKDGRFSQFMPNHRLDLIVEDEAPKRTVWVNLYHEGGSVSPIIVATVRDTQEEADRAAEGVIRLGNRAYPVEIDGDA